MTGDGGMVRRRGSVRVSDIDLYVQYTLLT